MKSMWTFIAKRVGSALTLLLVVSFLGFMLLYPAAGNVGRNILGENATQEQVTVLNEQLGLDRPLLVQYGDWLLQALSGNLGVSYFTNQPVDTMLAIRLPVTISVVVLVLLFTGIFAFAIGVWAAKRRGWVDKALQFFATLGDALPNFIIAFYLVTFFSLQLGWFAATDYTPLGDSITGWMASLVLPVGALTIGAVGGVVQQVRSSTIEVLEQGYVRTLRSRGLSERRVVLTSVLRNSATNGTTALGVQIVAILSGAVVIEQIFALPGLGALVVQATHVTDLPIVIGALMTFVIIVALVNLLIDLINAWLNPKVRVS